MSRRRSHHSFEDDYGRIIDHHIRTTREPRGIEYQDDSLSSINSDDDEPYLTTTTTKKETTYFPKLVKPAANKEKITDASSYQLSTATTKEAKESKQQVDNTSERLGRLESMLEQLIKRDTTSSSTTTAAPAAVKPELTSSTAPNGESSPKSSEQFHLQPRCHSFTTSMWINHIQEESVTNNWNEKTTIKYMESLMSGIVKAWYNNLPDQTYTWPEWKILITKMFPDNIDFVTTLKRLVTRLKLNDESMTNYFFSKSYLLEACKITGSDAVSCLIDGLNKQSVQEQAKSHNFLTPEQLYSNFLLNLPDYTVDYLPGQSEVSYEVESSEISKDVETEESEDVGAEVVEDLFSYREEVEEEEEQEEFGHGKRKSSRDNERISTKRTTVHSRLDKRFIKAPYTKWYNTMPLAAKICGKCGHRGHSAYTCRTRMFQCNARNSPASKSCYYKKCVIDAVTFEGFVDTGCNSFIVTESVAKVLDLEVVGPPERIEGYGGGCVHGLGRARVGAVEVDGAVVEDVEAVVVEDSVQDVDVVIGQAFLNRKNVTMILSNDRLSIFNSGKLSLIIS